MNRLVFSMILLAACNSDGRDPMLDPSLGTDASMPGSGGSTSPDAPKILSLNTNLSMMTATDRLVVSAVVTDPDGIDDLIGGNLMMIGGSSAYGSFATAAGEGAYSISLSWNDIGTVEPINTAAGASASRGFRASFFDVAGHTVYRDIYVSLGCTSTAQAACDGDCMTVDTVEHCGSCDRQCPNPSVAHCLMVSGGSRECFSITQFLERKSCSELCRAPYDQCFDAAVEYGYSGQRYPVACSATPEPTRNEEEFWMIHCACTE
jgi:hypothetical protein